jgi:uncharacterized cupin superfamily protein
MCLRPGEEIGDEVHSNVDRFFHIEQGEAKFVFNKKKERPVHDGDAVVVPAGTYHNVVNTSKTAMLKLYTIYSPPNARMGQCARLKPRRRLQNRWNTANQHETGCHETKYIRDMGLAFYNVDYWACGCLDLGRHPRLGAEMNWYSL